MALGVKSRSDALSERAQAVVPGGVNSPVRAFRSVGGTPRFIARGEGAWLEDVDGKRYVDLVLSYSMVPDRIAPDSCNAVAHRVGASRARAFGIEVACATAVAQLEIAQAFVEAGLAKVVLMTQSHLLARALTLPHPASPGLGDAATAMVVARGSGLALRAVHTRTHGEYVDAVTWVRPSGGLWHHEFVNMVTPDEFKGYGAIFTNGEKAGLAVQGMLSALAFKYLPGAIAAAVKQTRERAAKREVAEALEEFYVTHPGTRPAPEAERLP